MRIFISWSGPRSRAIAEALHRWFPRVLPFATPWFSSVDLEAGQVWDPEVHKQLKAARYGIAVLTADKLQSAAIHYEAGHLAGRGAPVCCYLIGGAPPPPSWPLGRFQAKNADWQETLQLLKIINRRAWWWVRLPEARLTAAFEKLWPDVAAALRAPAAPERVIELTGAPGSPFDFPKTRLLVTINTDLLRYLGDIFKEAPATYGHRWAALGNEGQQLQAEELAKLPATLGEGQVTQLYVDRPWRREAGLAGARPAR